MDTIMCKCPACGAVIISDTETKEVNCPYCGTNVSTVEYKEYKEAADPEIRNAAEHDTGNPFIVYCKNCGAPAGYDISKLPVCALRTKIRDPGGTKGLHTLATVKIRIADDGNDNKSTAQLPELRCSCSVSKGRGDQ